MRPQGLNIQAELPRGFAVGRYLVLDRIGSGGHGDIYTAYDPERGRKIVLRLLRTGGPSIDSAHQSQKRMLQQVQALTLLTHPQVVSVYEIGTLGEQVFIAMEFIEGVTLKTWLGQQPRSQQEILDAFILAGRGLAAAHAAGVTLVNFKTDSVLVGQDGRICVTDLGLADGLTSGPHHFTHCTAPEQREGKPVEIRTDIFNYSASLYEALYGELPFVGDTRIGPSIGDVRGPLDPGVSSARSPQSWLNKVLLRGTHSEPDKRYPSMNALLAALSRQKRQTRRWWIGGGVTGALGALLFLGWYVSALVKQQQLICSGATAKLARVWDPHHKIVIHDSLLRTGKTYAEETWQRVEQALDQYSAQWAAMHTEACQATRIRGEQSEALLDLRMQCLDRRLADLTALTQLLGKVEPAWVDKVTSAAQELTPVGVCADVVALTAQVPLPDQPGKRARLDNMLRQLSEVVAMQRLGQYGQAQEAEQALVQAAHELGYAPFEAEALYWLGVTQNHRGHSPAAAETLLRAAAAGVAGRDLRIAARAWTRLISITGFNLQQPAESQKWELLASAAVSALGDSSEAKFDLASARCVAAYHQQTQDRTLTLCQESLAAAVKAYGPSHFYVSAQMNNLADVLAARNQIDQALSFYRQSLLITQQQLGESHPSVAIHLNNLGETLGSLGEYKEALSYLQQAVELQQRVLEPGHVQRGVVLATLGELQWNDGQVAAAGATLKESVKILGAGFPPGHSNLIATQISLTRVLLAQQNAHEAQQLAESMLPAEEKIEPSKLADVYYLLGQALARQQRYSEALSRHKEALALHEKASSQPGKLSDLSAIGTDLILLGQSQEALPLLEQAVQNSLAPGMSSEVRATSQFALAQALWQLNNHLYGERTLRLLAAARAVFAQGGPKYQVELDELDRWLAARHLHTSQAQE